MDDEAGWVARGRGLTGVRALGGAGFVRAFEPSLTFLNLGWPLDDRSFCSRSRPSYGTCITRSSLYGALFGLLTTYVTSTLLFMAAHCTYMAIPSRAFGVSKPKLNPMRRCV